MRPTCRGAGTRRAAGRARRPLTASIRRRAAMDPLASTTNRTTVGLAPSRRRSRRSPLSQDQPGSGPAATDLVRSARHEGRVHMQVPHRLPPLSDADGGAAVGVGTRAPARGAASLAGTSSRRAREGRAAGGDGLTPRGADGRLLRVLLVVGGRGVAFRRLAVAWLGWLGWLAGRPRIGLVIGVRLVAERVVQLPLVQAGGVERIAAAPVRQGEQTRDADVLAGDRRAPPARPRARRRSWRSRCRHAVHPRRSWRTPPRSARAPHRRERHRGGGPGRRRSRRRGRPHCRRTVPRTPRGRRRRPSASARPRPWSTDRAGRSPGR